PAHTSDAFCELVCSNSLKSDDVWGNACGLLKEEMRRLGSLTMEAADRTRVPAGGALAVDRDKFSAYVTQKLRQHPNIHIVCREQTSLPEAGIVATGPLTEGALYAAIGARFGGGLHFYDATAPIVTAESIDSSAAFTADRYGRGTGDYVNCPMTKEEYETFVTELLAAEKVTLKDFERREIFEGCMPVEVMASRGRDALRFGTFKPVGLADESGRRPYAVLQLRRENAEGSLLGLVGCQTNLKFGEQKRVFSLIPALKHAEFVRYGVMHRNTFLDAPRVLSADFSVKDAPMLFFAGQITGVEGYVESAMSGMLAGIHYWRKLHGKPPIVPSDACVMGALSRYIAAENKHFQPMNANYGILRGLDVRDKKEKKRLLAERALGEIDLVRAALAK
ncbi:MAG TPA: methylenetetrahydrofolate--tRNA-(uracil(54)-C(5))-methyltransferase (FADH(2)-oxidizing) TrmFO, partial [Candidatus Gallimonas intestinigallinarum]|nr:methylenetetrahydrofolate--tRNA-(uracil(54)-C(5))-methyltransferase (FADH(2)-oxidizing) TrmFO [Candidatus Gallimonas intestinigallinarum]